jgi:hypothetical protein
MNITFTSIFAGTKQLGTLVPKLRKSFDWHEETTRTICSREEIREI